MLCLTRNPEFESYDDTVTKYVGLVYGTHNAKTMRENKFSQAIH